MTVRREWIERDGGEGLEALSVGRQCALAGVARSGVYRARVEEALDAQELRLLELIDAEYTRRPFYGSRRMVRYLLGNFSITRGRHIKELR